MFSYKRFITLQGLLQNGDMSFVSAVSHGNSQVARISAPFCAFERAALEALIKLNGCQSQV